MEKLSVPLADRSYPLLIGQHILTTMGDELDSIGFPRRVAVISNPTVDALYGDQVSDALQRKGFNPFRFNVPDGEEYKNLDILESVYDALIKQGFDRGCGLVALGGGVIGDMAGFAAATYLRGVPYVQVPTTLLAQVDSSVGGKTAVNHSLGKNLIGAFYQPEAVFIDVETLKTLEKREVSAGLAEVVKYGVIRDADFFTWLETHAQNLKQGDPQALIHAVKVSCQIKSEIVAQDEREGSIRAYLNFGHTFGHAIETLSGYGQWKHGEAVAAGMVVAANISAHFGLCQKADVERLVILLKTLDLPIVPPKFPLAAYIEAMQRDKKVKKGMLSLVLNCGIGDVTLKQVTDLDAIFSSVLNSGEDNYV